MTTKEKLVEAIEELPEEKLTEALKFVRKLGKQKATGKKNKWADFAGFLTGEDAKAMKAVIEEEFEKVEEETQGSRN